ncbi:MAG TPA: TIGR02587 family membrane protein [Bauldia sp.]|nr:TIGR02587 family membrane protein [Bauldia sp.]
MKWPDKTFLAGLARASGGALVFAIPMLMTLEMWSLGHSADPIRLAILLSLIPLLLIGLAHYVGFRESSNFVDHLADAFVAIGVAALGAALLLGLFGLLEAGMATRELAGRVGMQVVPGSIGAMLSRSQLGQQPDGAERRRITQPTYMGELFLMLVGALFLSLSVAPTDEVVHIAHMMAPWQEIALVVLSLVVMHVFVYFVEFRAKVPIEPGASLAGLFVRFTVVGYVIVLAVSLLLLWVFGRADGLSLAEVMSAAIVLSFPGAIGAAAARLLL